MARQIHHQRPCRCAAGVPAVRLEHRRHAQRPKNGQARKRPQAARRRDPPPARCQMSRLAIDAAGRFCGYASLFGRPDQGGDIVMPGAFARSLGRRGRHAVRMLFQHDPKEPVGLWERIAEDAEGLWVEGRLLPACRPCRRAAGTDRQRRHRRAVDRVPYRARQQIGRRAEAALADRSLGNLHRHLSDDGWRADRFRRQDRTGPENAAARCGCVAFSPPLDWVRQWKT